MIGKIRGWMLTVSSWYPNIISWFYPKSSGLSSNEALRQQIHEVLQAGCISDVEQADFNAILGELYLGNSRAFLQCTHLTLRDDRFIRRPLDIHNNQHQFSAVVTVCSQRDLCGDCIDLIDQDLSKALSPVEWFYVGRTIEDDPALWISFVHDCTFPQSILAQQEQPEDEETYNALHQEKGQAMKGVPSEKWFAPIFDQLDQAVFRNKKTLVHCQRGVSRSATLIAAYLISRFGLQADEAVRFLKIRRACVEPKFMKHLEDFAASLRD